MGNAKKEYCKFCWAYYHSTSCIASAETRPSLCEKAKKRMCPPVSEKEKTNDENVNVKKYLRYIQNRLSYLKILSGDIPSNEYRFYQSLQKSINEWGKKHAIFYGCLTGKITTAQAKSSFGCSEKTFRRMMRAQKKSLIKFIEKQEEILSDKYPFIPMADIFE